MSFKKLSNFMIYENDSKSKTVNIEQFEKNKACHEY